MWTQHRDFRVICSCQLHEGKGRTFRNAAGLAKRGAALILSIPLALAALDLPTEAMDRHLTSIEAASVVPSRQTPPAAAAEGSADFPIFTSRRTRDRFLSDGVSVPSLDVFKEDYFRSQVPYGAIIYREARRNDVPPELIAAMVRAESDFRPGLVSNKSAQGLMQIVPGTARLLGVANPFDPEQNIAAGTRYFRYLLDRFDDETVALAAYNAGEGNVSRFGGIPPFAETRAYIARVRRHTDRYREGVRTSYVTAMKLSDRPH